jgi:uncharacterized protein YbjT (DUF2867 family)
MLGRAVADELRNRGETVRVLSRHSADYRVDLTTGEGLEAALAGCTAVVDTSNNPNAKKARELLVDGTRRLTAAAKAAGVQHYVAVSILGCERVPVGYYRIKVEQEAAVSRSQVPWTIVRATQFHGYVADAFAMTAKAGVVPILKVPLQTVAVSDVARVIADSLAAGPRGDTVAVAGPEVTDARALARTWKSARHSRALPLPVPLPGKIGRALREGALTAAAASSPGDVVRGTVTFDQWLAAQGSGSDSVSADAK